MTTRPISRTGGQILVDQLIIQGATDVFCVPGESYLAVLDALHDADTKVTICRQEGGAAMMAEAYGKLTGRPGICMVTRGPGATNASPGLHIAQQDSSPMILFVGQIDRSMRGRDAFQEVDYGKLFGGIAKWVAEIDEADRIPEMVARAYATAMQGRPGPVVLVLPEDMLTDTAEVPDAPRVEAVESWPGNSDMMKLQKLLWAAKKPVLVLGGSRWSDKAVGAVTRFAERFELPVVCQFRRQMLFDHGHANYAGDLGLGCNPAIIAMIKDSDLIIALGGRLSEIASQSYTLIDIPQPSQTLVHIHPGPEELGRVYQAHLPIQASPTAFAAAVEGLQPPQDIAWKGSAAKAHESYLGWTGNPARLPGALQYGEIMAWLRDRLPDDAIVCNGAGNYAIWVHRFLRFRRYGSQLAPTCGSMGYGTPAAVGAKRMYPEKTVVAFAGDGCFMMNGQEFATACQYDLPIVVIVVDNGMYGTIRMHQERDYPGRVVATALKNPDFAALARAYGGHGETVRETSEFAPAFERAVASGKPAILHLFLDQQAITPATTIDQIRAKAQGKG
ncbi:thiamine pyrophosphate-binding protein [Phreatobacter sp. AB_2022a]|uniref:thiamine pyrophosphate-binding protein n=1 Tax=Phreatobacter sp. AB_2022a TaxID=3003134 RepID=UPI0022871CB7|nr:thiamine pyrophosphate-binding protein [Phreatobacter sp. AB_2022a]MCZ0735711.1 thiamine pyrophosphate-binding protein [Phreatobacter sp. AB_2022a]